MGIEKMIMPQLGESVTEGTISKWLVSPGDTVSKYDPIAEVMTDKVNAEIPSSFAGIIKELKVREDETIAVGEPICTIEVQNEAKVQVEVRTATDSQNEHELTNHIHSNSGRYSPAVLRLSQQHNLDLASIQGTGAGGRITRKDIMKIIESGSASVKAEAVSPVKEHEKPATAAIVTSTFKQEPLQSGDLEIPVSAVRKAIAANMLRSKQEIPHAWMMVEVDATKLVALRNAEKTTFKQKEGFNLTYFAFFVKAVAQALKEYPQLNSTWAGDKIIQKRDIHLSIAVAVEDSLFVPVINYADEKTIKGIAREIAELSEKAKYGKLKAEDMQGGTFTVNNTGSFGSVQSSGIINYPQAAILQIESIKKRPVIVDDMIAVRDIVNLCLSLDHRVLDGLICGRFLARVKEIIENMSKETMSIY